MQNKNPNGPDRKLPSTEQELEQYGVWVKAEPQDVVEEPETEHAILDEIDSLDIDAIDIDDVSDDTLLSFEEEQELDGIDEDKAAADAAVPDELEISFDDDTVLADDFGLDDDFTIDSVVNPPKKTGSAPESSYELVSNSEYELKAENPAGLTDELSDLGIDDLELEPESDTDQMESLETSEFSLDEFEDDFEMPETVDSAAVAKAEVPVELGVADRDLESSIEDLESDIIDIPLDDLDYDAPIDQKTDEVVVPHSNGHSDASLETTEISLDEFGFGDEELGSDDQNQTESSNVPSTEFEEVSFDEPETDIVPEDEMDEASKSVENDEFYDPIDLDLQFDDTIPSHEDNAAANSIDFNPDEIEDLSGGTAKADDFDADALLADVFGEEESPDRIPNADSEKTLDFSAPERGSIAMPSGFPEPNANLRQQQEFDDIAAVEKDLGMPASKQSAGAASDASSQLLLQIASELSSIKSELMSLRSQLKEIKAAPASAAEPGIEPQYEESEETQDAAKGGFFDEEDDETIALTGDELDNILNTADFTEETLVEESLGEEAAQDSVAPDTVKDDQFDLLPEDGEYTISSGIETIELDEPAESKLEEPAITEIDQLELAENIVPITEAPEDTSYLEDEIEAYPLEDTPLEEPDLSEINLDDVLVEAETDATEELPLVNALDTSIPDPTSDAEIEELELSDDETFLEIEEDISFEDDISLDIAGEEDNLAGLEYDTASIPEIEETFDLDDDSDLAEIELHAETNVHAESSENMEPGKTSEPVQVHPDELSMSLDDSFFVDSSEPTETDVDDFKLEEVTEFELEPEPEPEPEMEPVSPIAAEKPAAKPSTAPIEAKTPELVPNLGIPAQPAVPDKLTHDIKSVLVYLDQLLSALPEEKIEEFASSEYYDTYKKLFEELGIL